MAGVDNNLYPPIISSWMPAFVRTTSCKIYFSLSTYNSIKDIKNVQVVVSNQNTNLSVLNIDKYPTGIKITNLGIDNDVNGDNKYFIIIEPEDLESGIFELNQFYKIQIRFTGVEAASILDIKKIASWLTNNQKYFSEWSTVCLIKGIQQPSLYIKGFENSNSTTDTIFTTEVVDFVGSMYYEENNEIEKEYLKSYQILLYNNNTNILLFNSNIIYTNEYNPNEINYTLPYNLEDGISYRVEIIYTTNNGYSDSVNYIFSVIQNSIDSLDATISAYNDESNGRIKIHIFTKSSSVFLGNITIRRTSSESNFTIWEDVNTTTLKEDKILDYTWYDYTIKSGVWYKYCAQRRSGKGDRGSIISIRKPIMIVFDDIFLTRDKMQLRIKYDPSISSFKQTLSESKTETIGSKYPYIRRNGNVGYKQFPISGLITSFCDEDGIFINKQNIFNELIDDYNDYNIENRINEYNDFIYEREFREKIMNFLQDNTVKLFRSTTEGNILVKLMDISFTPNQTLGRMLYSFSATAYEIDDCSIKNYNKYGIQNIGNYSSYIQHNFDKIGQLQDTFFSGSQKNIITLLQNKYELMAPNGFINRVNHIKWLRIEFNSEPYLINAEKDGTLNPLSASEQPSNNTVNGYIVYINEIPILVNQRGYYELRDEDTIITSVWFPVTTEATIDYSISIDMFEDVSTLASKLYYNTKVGQLWGVFNINDSISKIIYLKYLLNYKNYYQKLIAIDRVNIESTPGTIVYVKDSFDDYYYKHIIGETGILELYDEETIIEGLYFGGVHLNEVQDTGRNEILDTEFINTNIIVDSLNKIVEPIKNGVYQLDNSNKDRYIYYNNEWYMFTKDNNVLCPIEGLIDYTYEIVKGEY